ncbi:hypothetical protein D9613_012858 [Agrocybe pediades]|uniref:Uncharacterized protein n=1 Tax=Agrocybe pediades TaxID=84607 RepID=A0A8H4VS39_9AGAR|nr:hypothetical protein D9613_012858 [Agrocybe pediades]
MAGWSDGAGRIRRYPSEERRWRPSGSSAGNRGMAVESRRLWKVEDDGDGGQSTCSVPGLMARSVVDDIHWGTFLPHLRPLISNDKERGDDADREHISEQDLYNSTDAARSSELNFVAPRSPNFQGSTITQCLDLDSGIESPERIAWR